MLLPLLLLLLLASSGAVSGVSGATDVTSGLHPIRGATVSVAAAMFRQSNSAYTVQRPELELVSDVLTNNGLVTTAFFSGEYDYAVSTTSFTTKQQQQFPNYKAYPMVGNAIVPIYNLPASAGSEQLVLPLPVMCLILRGGITRWNDTQIQAANPKLVLPNLGISVLHLAIDSAQNDGITSLCGKVDPVFAVMIPRAGAPKWPPASTYFSLGSAGNSDVLCSLVIDKAGAFSMAALQNVKAVSVRTAAIQNLAGVTLQPTLNAISLNILELASQPLPPGVTVYDLTLPLTPAAWPICTMVWLWLDLVNPVTTCATKAATLNYLLWMYTSASVKSIAATLNQVVMPDLFLEQTGILEKLQRDVQCQDKALISTATARGYVQGYSGVASTLQLFSTVYYAQNSAIQLGFARAADHLSLQRLLAHEVDLAVLDHARVTDGELAAVQSAGATLLPFAMGGVAVSFTLPTAISAGGQKWTPDSPLPRLFPLALDVETAAQIFVANVTHWLDAQILATAPQLADWFAAFPAANKFFRVVTCCDAASADPAVAGGILLRGLQITKTAQMPQFKSFFQREVPDWSAQLAAPGSAFMSVDTEFRVTSKSISQQSPPYSLSTISYRLISGGESDPNAEFRLLHRGQTADLALAASPDNFGACLADELATEARAAATIGDPAYRAYVSGTEPGCYPLSAVVSVAVNLLYSGADCARGNYSLNFYKFAAAAPALSLAARNAGVLRLSDLGAIGAHVARTVDTATCDGAALLLTLPAVWRLNAAIFGFGISVVGVGLALLLASAALLFVYRARSLLRSSSVPFLALILLGLAMMISSIVPLVDDVTEQSCSAFLWLASVGFTLVFVPFFAKTWRIYMIFNRRHLRVVKLSNRKLFLCVSLVIALELSLLLAWTLVAPLQPVTYVRNVGGRLHQAAHCSVADGTGMAFVAVDASLKGALLLFGALMAFGTRKVSSAFNEAEAIAWAVYNSAFSALLVGAIIYFVDAFEDTLILLLLFLLFWIVTVAWALLFATKFFAILTTSEAKLEQISKVDSLHTERSVGGFSFVSVAHMPTAMIKGYIGALEVQIAKARKQLSIALGTAGATLGVTGKRGAGIGAATTPALPGTANASHGGGGMADGNDRDGRRSHSDVGPLNSSGGGGDGGGAYKSMMVHVHEDAVLLDSPTQTASTRPMHRHAASGPGAHAAAHAHGKHTLAAPHHADAQQRSADSPAPSDSVLSTYRALSSPSPVGGSPAGAIRATRPMQLHVSMSSDAHAHAHEAAVASPTAAGDIVTIEVFQRPQVAAAGASPPSTDAWAQLQQQPQAMAAPVTVHAAAAAAASPIVGAGSGSPVAISSAAKPSSRALQAQAQREPAACDL